MEPSFIATLVLDLLLILTAGLVSGAICRRTGVSMPVGSGPIGGRVASHLETTGVDVCLIELNPVNLHRFAQQGFRIAAGDASDREVLRHADIESCQLAVITVPDDDVAAKVVATIRSLNAKCAILVRCRYHSNLPALERAGADAVISEELEVGGALLRLPEQRQVL